MVTGLTFYNASVIAELIRSGVRSLPTRAARGRVGPRPDPNPDAAHRAAAAGDHRDAALAHQPAGGHAEGHRAGLQVTYAELLNQAKTFGTYKANLIPTLIVVAAIYIVINYAAEPARASVVENRLEDPPSKGGGAVPAAIAATGRRPPPWASIRRPCSGSAPGQRAVSVARDSRTTVTRI